MAARRLAVIALAGAARPQLPRAAGAAREIRWRWSARRSCSVLIVMALFAPWIATAFGDRPEPVDAADAAERRELDGHRRARPRHLEPRGVRLAHHAGDRAAGGRARGAARTGHRRGRRLFRRLDRQAADGHHRHLPVDAQADPGAGLRGRARARHPERHHRHRDRHLAGLCAHRARRDADHPQFRIHRGGRAAGRLGAARHRRATSCRSAPPR